MPAASRSTADGAATPSEGSPARVHGAGRLRDASPALPRNASGKVDRRALPAPPTERPATAQPYVAPARRWNNSWRASGAMSCGRAGRRRRQLFRAGRQLHPGGRADQPAPGKDRPPRLRHRAFRLADHRGPGALPGRGLPGRRPPRLRSGVALWRASRGRRFSTARRQGTSSAEAGGVAGRACSRREPARPGSWSIRRAGSWCATRPFPQRLGRERPFYGIRSRGLHGEPDLPGPAGGDGQGVRGRHPRGPATRTLPPRAVGPRGGWSRWRWPSNFWRKASRSGCSPCSTRSPKRPMIPTGPTGRAWNTAWTSRSKSSRKLGPDHSSPTSGSTP